MAHGDPRTSRALHPPTPSGGRGVPSPQEERGGEAGDQAARSPWRRHASGERLEVGGEYERGGVCREGTASPLPERPSKGWNQLGGEGEGGTAQAPIYVA